MMAQFFSMIDRASAKLIGLSVSGIFFAMLMRTGVAGDTSIRER